MVKENEEKLRLLNFFCTCIDAHYFLLLKYNEVFYEVHACVLYGCMDTRVCVLSDPFNKITKFCKQNVRNFYFLSFDIDVSVMFLFPKAKGNYC